ncbi:MAG: riboflavin kinase [Candidatus Magasanikbacteria bacterium]
MFSGIVVHGDGNGKIFGFPTANIDCQIKKGMNITTGVFASVVTIDNKKYNSAFVIMSKEKSFKFEVHILDLDFDSDLYGKYLEVDLVQKVSEVERYDSHEELLKKIKQDIEMVKEVFVGRDK